MRIDVLTANMHPKPDSVALRAESEAIQASGPFSALIGGMTASATAPADTVEDASTLEDNEKDSHEHETDAAHITPCALMPEPSFSDEVTGGEKELATNVEIPAGFVEAHRASMPQIASNGGRPLAMPAGDAESLYVPLTQARMVAEETLGTAAAAPVRSDDSLQTACSAASDPITSYLPAESALAIPAEEDLHLPQDKAAVPLQDAAPIPSARDADKERIAEQLAQAVAVPEAFEFTTTPSPGAGSPGVASVSNRPGMLIGPDGSPLTKGQGARQPSVLPEIGDHAGKSKGSLPGENGMDRGKAPAAVALPSSDAQQVIPGPDTITDMLGADDRSGSRRMAADANGAGNSRRAKESAEESSAATVDSTDSPWTSLQSVQRLLVPNQSARMNVPGASAFPTFKSGQHSVSTSAAYFADGLQPGHTAGIEIKSLIALLAPRQSTPTQSTDFLAQLTDRIGVQIRDNRNILTIQLKPNALGRMAIKAETSSAGVLATIVTESARVRDFIEQNLPLLQQSFLDQGIKVERISVTVQDGSPHQTSAGHQETHADSHGTGGFGFPSRFADDFGPAGEELTVDPQDLLVRNPHGTFHVIA